MQKIKVVIGASYGDEGKGLATDFFAANGTGSTIGVVMNGGPQRGHTVETADGLRHVFHHWNAGALRGVPTYCAEEFILNPMVCMEEYDLLSGMGYRPGLVIHPGCRFTTPYDMLINQIVLESEGLHNSCGMGIWETIVRHGSPYALRIGAFAALSEEERDLFLREIRDQYLPERLKKCGIARVPEPFAELLSQEGLLRHYLEDMERMLKAAQIRPTSFLTRFENVIFENGQGLLLDGNNPETYDDSTPSTTGLGRIARTIEQHFEGAQVEVCYVSRSYLTRHGDGSLPGECCREEIGSGIQDLTNETNPFQGTLRYAKIERIDELAARVRGDFSRRRGTKNHYENSMLITHLNELPMDLSALQEQIPRLYTSEGRTAESVEKFQWV